MKNTLDTNSRNKKNILIIGSNSHFRYGKYTLPLDSYNIKLTTKGYIEAMGSALGDIVKFNKKHHYISIQAFRIKDKVLDEIIHFKGLQKGRYTIKMEGNPQKIMKGEILIEGGMMKNFSTYKKTADLVNTIPELSSLHKQHYAQKGFKIEEGMINYKVMNQNHIYFDSIYVKGEIATLVGKGSIDLLTKVIDIHLEIHLARNMGQVLGNIPLLGYILMGKDKSITVGLHISGTLDKPIVHTSAVTDILSSPFGIIKRTLESPNHIINQ